MNIYQDFAVRIETAMQENFPQIAEHADLLARATVEPPRDADHGDLSSNIAMVCAKPLQLKPRDVAQKIAEAFGDAADIDTVEVAGPGFLNFRLAPSAWQNVLKSIVEDSTAFAKPDLGQGTKVNVEFVSANPTGPMHVGHTRGAVFGDALASILAFCGYDVTREYYVNDAGGQTNILAQSAFLRYREALGEEIGEIPEGLYPGGYLVPVGKHLAEKFGDTLLVLPQDEQINKVKPIVLEKMLDLIRADLAALGVQHDVFFSEKTLHGDDGIIAQTLDWLKGIGLVYQGTLEPPKGKEPEDWEDREQTLFKAADYGDDTDRPLVKSNGDYTYFAADIAYHRDKYLRGFNEQIIALGADHSGYVKRLKAAVKVVSDGEAEIDVKLCQIVRLLRDGQPFKMSKRSGDLVTLADLVGEVGRDAARFMLVLRKNDAMMDFDFARVVEQTRDNPVFYVQYAHARTCSVERAVKSEMPDLDILRTNLKTADLSLLDHAADLELMRALAQMPRQLIAAANTHEPHRLANYLYQLSSAFHGFWSKGNSNEGLRFVNANNANLTLARLALAYAVRDVLATGLEILGVSAPEQLS